MGWYGGMPVIKNSEATVFCSDLDQKVDEQLLYELMIQAGPVKSVTIPRDRISSHHKGFAYVEFENDYDAEYAIKIFENNVKLFGKQIKLNKNTQPMKKTIDVGANLFVNNIDASVDETILNEAFRNFGNFVCPMRINKNEKTKKCYAFISYDNFDSADKAIANLNGQIFGGRKITVEYAFKNKKGERYGDEAERILAKNNYD